MDLAIALILFVTFGFAVLECLRHWKRAGVPNIISIVSLAGFAIAAGLFHAGLTQLDWFPEIHWNLIFFTGLAILFWQFWQKLELGPGACKLFASLAIWFDSVDGILFVLLGAVWSRWCIFWPAR